VTPLFVADKVYFGQTALDRVCLGSDKLWPPAPSGEWTPASLPGLAIWLDASQIGLADGAAVAPWTNLANASLPGSIDGVPPPKLVANGKNGLPIVRFSASEGRVRFSGTGITTDWTLVYVAHLIGPTVGRLVTCVVGATNNLYGFWNGYQDVGYDSGFMVPNTQTAWTTDWKLYSADGAGSTSRLLSDGTVLGSWTGAGGWNGTLAISGLDYGDASEACDCEVAELIFYSRKLSDADRRTVEAYLRAKWGMT
jgi:hypothetical protein